MMKRWLIIAGICLFVCLEMQAQTQPQLARLHYSGGGDWYNDQDILPNIAHKLNATLHTNFSSEQAVVKPSDPAIFDYPFIFATGHGNFVLDANDRDNLRRYISNGGFLYIDDDYGMDASVRAQLAQLFPQYQLTELPGEHPLFNSYFPLGSTPKIHKHDDKRPQTLAIIDETGRILVLYTYETNISDGWSNNHDDPAGIKELAVQMGVNIFYYLMAR